MDYLSYEKRLAYILELIEKNRFRSLVNVAKGFDCSTRTVKRMIAHLRETGNDIRYDRLNKKYYLKKDE